MLHNYKGISFEINVDDMTALEFRYGDNYIIPRFTNNTILTSYLPRSYHHIGKNITMVKKNYLICKQKRNVLKSFYYETRNELSLLKSKHYKIILARLITKIFRLFKTRELWFISDRVAKADDNGEHFFKYMLQNHPDKNVYFVLTKDSSDFERLSKIGKVIDPNSFKYKLLFHSADYVLSSHAENYIINPLGKSGIFIQDLYDFKFIFLQHGVIYNDLSSWLNVNSKKIDMFVTSCTDEYNSFFKYKYQFGKDVVKLTGLPRYDGLQRNKKKYKTVNKIMLSLTWRNTLSTKYDKKNGLRVYNPKFKESNYYDFLNSVMNDKKLQKVLKEYGYIIRFIPHPNVMCQLEDFEKNDFVEIEEGTVDYQKEFCQNKLLITDYSSIAFDFAYLNKPIIYFQDDEEEFYAGQIYDKGYFDFDKMGFGPICREYNAFINKLIEMIKNDCKMENKYQKRVEKFFAFHDSNNFERVYKEIKKL